MAVQAKRWAPEKSVARDVVALFQRDAVAAGAERAVLITLGRFTPPARKAATRTAPTVELIDGERLAALVKEHRIGLVTAVDGGWFDRFETEAPAVRPPSTPAKRQRQQPTGSRRANVDAD